MKLFLSFLILTFMPVMAFAQQIETTAKQAYVVDFDTGTVLFQKDADMRMPTASMSKVMTMLGVFEALEDRRISLDDELLVSEKAWRKGGSKMFVEVGKQVKVEDLIRGVIVQSGNDATIVLAEALGGTEENFARQITELAQEIGMQSSNFTNASGWPDENHYSTAKDLAVMARYLIKTYPEYYKYYSELEFEFNGITQENRNPLLYRNIGADGIKTGHTEEAGYGLVGSGAREDRRVIIVLNGMTSMKERADEATRILDWSLRNFTNKTLFLAGEPIGQVEVALGGQEKVSLTVSNDVFLTLPLSNIKDIQAFTEFKTPVVAPISAGDELGTLIISIPDYGRIEAPLIAAETVPELGFFSKTLQKIKLFFRHSS